MRHATAIIVILVLAWTSAGCTSAPPETTGPTTLASSAAPASVAGASPGPRIAAPSPSTDAGSSPTGEPSAGTDPPLIPGDAEILYNWWDEGTDKELWVAHADGTDRHVIARDIQPGTRHGDESWSHDGSRIVFQAGDLYHSSIWIADATGGDGRRLLEPDDECRLGMSSPAWAPDDSRILFVCNDGASDTDPHFTSTIEVLTLATGKRRTVIGVPAPSQIVYAGWSRDGKTIVYQQGEYAADLRTEVGSAIRSIPAAGGKPRIIIDASMSAAYPYWSPTDDRILFSTNGYNFQKSAVGSNLFTVKSDGTQIRQLTDDSVDGRRRYMATGWTLDGSAVMTDIALAADGTALNDVHLGIVSADGGRPMPIVGNESGSWARIRPTP